MRCIDLLHEEHDLIRRALRVGDAMAACLAAGRAVLAKDLAILLDFFVTFAEGHHHRKEEFLVASWLQNHGIPSDIGPIACMRMDHQALRVHLEALGAAARGVDTHRHRLITALSGLSSRLRTHIDQEERTLFRLVNQLASDCTEADRELWESFQEAVPEGPEIYAYYQDRISELERDYRLDEDEGSEGRNPRPAVPDSAAR